MEVFVDTSIIKKEPKFDWRPLAVFGGGFLLEAILQIVLAGVDKNPSVINTYDSLSWLLGKVAAIILVAVISRKRVAECSLQTKQHFGKYFLYVLIAFGVFFLFDEGTAYYQQFMDKILNIGETTNQEAIYKYFEGSRTALNYIILFLTIVIAAPLLEELEYRELIFRTFRGMHWTVPLIISSLLFGLVHMQAFTLQEFYYFPIYFIPGLALGLIYHYSKNNFWTNFAVHSAINLIGFVLIVINMLNNTGGGISI